MARAGRPKTLLTVTDEQRAQLMRGARAASSTQAFALRCRIVLACADPAVANAHVAAELGVSVPTIAKWRNLGSRAFSGQFAIGQFQAAIWRFRYSSLTSFGVL